MAVADNWWEGTQHSNPNAAKADSALAVGGDVTAGNRSTQNPSRPEEGAGSGKSDWKCPGNHFKGRECGHWNFRNAEKCRKCGSYRRLS